MLKTEENKIGTASFGCHVGPYKVKTTEQTYESIIKSFINKIPGGRAEGLLKLCAGSIDKPEVIRTYVANKGESKSFAHMLDDKFKLIRKTGKEVFKPGSPLRVVQEHSGVVFFLFEPMPIARARLLKKAYAKRIKEKTNETKT